MTSPYTRNLMNALVIIALIGAMTTLVVPEASARTLSQDAVTVAATPATGTMCPKGTGGMKNVATRVGSMWRVTSTGCPPKDWSGQKTPNIAKYQNFAFQFPVSPVIASTKTYIGLYASGTTKNTFPIMGQIGFALNGIALYNDANADLKDAYVAEKATFDTCNAHADMRGIYHYHSETPSGCVYNSTSTAHSPMFGIMLDGIPIFGPKGDGGVAPTNLDECGGHTDRTYGYYHYHTTNGYKAPYLVKCLVGCIFHNFGNTNVNRYVKTNATCVKNAKQYNYGTMSIKWQ